MSLYESEIGHKNYKVELVPAEPFQFHDFNHRVSIERVPFSRIPILKSSEDEC